MLGSLEVGLGGRAQALDLTFSALRGEPTMFMMGIPAACSLVIIQSGGTCRKRRRRKKVFGKSGSEMMAAGAAKGGGRR